MVGLGRPAAIAPRQRQGLNRTARSDDGCLGRLRERVGLHLHGAGDGTAPEDLDERALVGEAELVQRLGRDGVEAAGLEHVEVERLVLDAERVVEALELRDPHVEGKLAALEAGGDGPAGVLALGATAGGLAALAADASADALAVLGRTGRGLEIVDLHESASSSTVIRWGTRAIMPRISGRSG